tara:strand:- start:35802 stop:36053 length:252 start_codon:yes stop_codon:yes gene_type:complete
MSAAIKPVEQATTAEQPISGYHRDDEGHWVAQLACGHNQHVRHDPPLVHREWVKSAAGRESMIGFELGCKNVWKVLLLTTGLS